MRFKLVYVICLLLFSAMLSAQSVFEKAEEGNKDKDLNYELNGYIRSTLFVGKVIDANGAELKSGYGEASFKLKIRKSNFGDTFAEVRFRRGYEFDHSLSEINLREAYLNAYLGPFDFRIGHQIVAWGRADGFNPTDNITPRNMLVRSPDEDDRREGNFLIRAHYNVHPFRLEAIWAPSYRYSVVPTDLLPFPPGVHLIDPEYPNAKLKHSAFAFRLNFEWPAIDGSISYFNGHNPFPGIAANAPEIPTNTISQEILLKSYRMHVLGADFQTTVAGSLGLRGEIAYRKPHDDYETSIHIPNPDLHYVLGIDKEFSGSFSLILQYMGRIVFDFKDLQLPMNQVERFKYVLEGKNRLINSQQYEISHSLSWRSGQSLLHETLRIELLGLFNMTSEEILLRPKLTYDLTDAFTFIVGGELFSGSEETLFGAIDSALNSIFLELKASF